MDTHPIPEDEVTERTRLEVRASEIRQRLNELGNMPELTDEHRTEIDTLSAEFRDVETRSRALAIAGDPVPVTETLDAEGRELRSIREKVKVGSYVTAAVESRSVDGAEAELNQALKMGRDRFPLRLLAPRAKPVTEQRAVTAADAGVMQETWLDRLFSMTAAMMIGVTFDSVPHGKTAHPVTTGGGAPAQKDPAQTTDDAAWTVGVTELKPKRSSVRAVFTIEDAARLGELEDALQRDLRMAMTERIDRAVFLGDDNATTAANDIVGLQTASGVTEKTITQANKVTGSGVLAAFASLVDGKHAGSLANLNVVLSQGAHNLWASQYARSAGASERMILEVLKDNGIMPMTRGDIETGTVNDDFAAFVGLARGIEGAGVAPVWEAGQLIRDPYSNAQKGEVALSLHYLWDFGLPRASNFARVKFVT